MRSMWTAAAIAVFLIAAFPGSAAAGISRAAAPSEQDKNYLISAHQFNLAQINSGQLARLKGTAGSVRELASKIVTDHLALDEALIPVANDLQVILPAQPTDQQKTTQAQLESMNAGADFDREWLAAEQAGHTTAINEGQAEISGGTDPKVIKLAQDASPVLSTHHAAMTRASTAASPPSHVDSGSGGFADPRRTLIPLAITGIGLLLILSGVTLRRRSQL
jgi:putative membrane protein